LKAASALLSGDHRTVGGERKLSLGKVLVLVIVLVIATVGDVDAAVGNDLVHLRNDATALSLQIRVVVVALPVEQRKQATTAVSGGTAKRHGRRCTPKTVVSTPLHAPLSARLDGISLPPASSW
jgi:hypothetical protein